MQAIKRIGFVTLNDHVKWGGSEVFWSELAEHFNRDNFETAVSVMHWGETPAHIEQLRNLGSKFFYRYSTREFIPVSYLKRILNLFLPSKFSFKAKPKLKWSKFDILHQFKPQLVFVSLGDHITGMDWMTELRLQNIPYIVVVQLVKDGYCLADNSDAYKKLREGYLGAKKILFTSHDNKQILEKQLYIEFANAEIINNPIKQPKNPIPYVAAEKFCIANVASLNIIHKAQDILLEVLRNPKWQQRNVEFNFYGTGPHETILKKLAEMWNLKNCHFRGFETIENIWCRNHILIMPSRFEGLSLAFLEAMNLKRTVIHSNVGDAGRFIQDNVNGFIIKGCEREHIDEALERAWNKREQWREMGERAYETLKGIIPADPVKSYYDRVKMEL